MLPPLIRAVDYDPVKSVLTVSFQCGVYEYKSVPASTAQQFLDCVGNRTAAPFCDVEFFNAKIEGKFKSERIGQ